MTERRPLVLVAGKKQELPTGDTLPGVGGWTQIASVTTTSGTTADFTSIPTTYQDLLVVFEGISPSTTANFNFQVSANNGSNWSSSFPIFGSMAAASAYYGGFMIPRYRGDAGFVTNPGLGAISSPGLEQAAAFYSPQWRATGGINALRFSVSAGNFDAGAIKLFGK